MTLVRKTPLAKPLASAVPGHSRGAGSQPLASTRIAGGVGWGGGARHRGRRKFQTEVGGERWPPPPPPALQFLEFPASSR